MTEYLNVVGRKIINQCVMADRQGWIQLDDGRKIYIDTDELLK